MKKLNIVLFMLMTLILQSCLHDDKDVFSTSAAERMQARLIENENILRAAPNGWLMKFYPNRNLIYGGYSLFVKFGDSNKVSIMSERGGKDLIMDSFYSLVGDSGPALRFDTHNDLIHYFSEPKNPDGIGPADSGMQGDFEFVIIEATAEKITMKGKKSGNTIIMVPIPAEKQWELAMDVLVKNSNELSQNSRFKLEIDGVEFEDPIQHKFRTLIVGDNYYPYIVTEEGIDLTEPMKIEGKEIQSFKLDKGDEDVVLINEEAGIKLLTMYPTLSEQLLQGDWSIVYSQTEQYSKLVFDVLKQDNLAKNNTELLAVLLASDVDDSHNYTVTLFTNNKDGNRLPSMYLMDYTVIDANTINIEFTGFVRGTKAIEYHENLGFTYIADLCSGTFKLTADSPIEPTKIRLENVEKPNKAFTLSKGQVFPLYEK